MSRRLQQTLRAVKWNIYTIVKNIAIKRDKRIILVGAWMGLKFADNSRYLYQYLYKNKNELGIKKVIWVTRNPDVNKSLNEMGYESYLVGTKESDYWHLKAGTHIVCNAVNDILGFHTDIDTRLSFGAKKIQLWHGVGGIKAVGAASNKARGKKSKNSFLKRVLHIRLLNSFLSEGGWAEAYVLATGKECAKAMKAYIGCRDDRLFVSGYPRNCQCLKLMDNEKLVMNIINKYKGTVLYLPTFRSDNSGFVHPLENSEIRSFIESNDILWMEKPHSADLNKDAVSDKSKNVYNLDSTFDINTIYKNVTCVITDYSSVAFDAVFHKKPLIIYAPDIEKFRCGDVGFIIDFEKYFEQVLCENMDALKTLIVDSFENSELYVKQRSQSYNNINQYAFDNNDLGYDQIWSTICCLR